MIRIQRTEDEIEKLLDEAYNRADMGSKFFGMSYEEGVKQTLLWLTEPSEANPLEG